MFIEAYRFRVPEIFAAKATEGTLKRVPIAKIRNKMNAQVQKIRRHEKLCGDIIYDVLCLNALLPYRKAQDKLQRAEDTSNLETDDEELMKKRRRCTVNYMTLYTGV